MVMLLGGCALMAATGLILATVLPRGGRAPRFAGTVLEPYLAIAVVGGFSVATAMIVTSLIALLGG